MRYLVIFAVVLGEAGQKIAAARPVFVPGALCYARAMGLHGREDEDGHSIWGDDTPLKQRLIWSFCFLLAVVGIVAWAGLLRWWFLMGTDPTYYPSPDWLKPFLFLRSH
jgi:hypothetical protein